MNGFPCEMAAGASLEAVVSNAPADRIEFIDDRPWRVRLGPSYILLSKTEYRILRAMVERAGQIVSRDEILQYVHGSPLVTTARTVDFHVCQLRRKLGGAGSRLETIRGRGYRYQAG